VAGVVAVVVAVVAAVAATGVAWVVHIDRGHEKPAQGDPSKEGGKSDKHTRI